jgi:hypothetical protein
MITEARPRRRIGTVRERRGAVRLDFGGSRLHAWESSGTR